MAPVVVVVSDSGDSEVVHDSVDNDDSDRVTAETVVTVAAW